MPHRRLLALILLFAPSLALGQAPLGNPAAAPTWAMPAASEASPWPLMSDRRLKFTLNPGPFAARFLSMPDAAPVEPRDIPFDARGELLREGPNTSPIWNSAADLDLAFGMRLTQRTDVLLGFALSARGRFTPRDTATPGGPSVYFLQFSRKW